MSYHDRIKEITNCAEADVKQVEDIMRNVVFHSTLDWQTREEFENGARLAYLVFKRLEEEDIGHDEG